MLLNPIDKNIIQRTLKFNSEFSPETCCLGKKPFLLGFGNFSGAKLLNFSVVVQVGDNFRKELGTINIYRRNC